MRLITTAQREKTLKETLARLNLKAKDGIIYLRMAIGMKVILTLNWVHARFVKTRIMDNVLKNLMVRSIIVMKVNGNPQNLFRNNIRILGKRA